MKRDSSFIYLLLLIVITSCIYSTEILFANGQINYRYQESDPFKIGFGTTPQSPTTGNLKLSLKINYINSEQPMIKGNVSFLARENNQKVNSINKNMIETIEFGHYHSNIEISTEGLWQFRFTINDGIQTNTVYFESNVVKRDPFQGILTSIALLAFIIALSLTIRTIIKNRSNNSVNS